MTDVIEPTQIEIRQTEVNGYDINIINYKNILSMIDGNWDNDLIYLKDMDAQEAARQCSMERLERLAELQLHDQVKNLLKTEIVERFKAQTILNSLINS
jgi:hypothetical protein